MKRNYVMMAMAATMLASCAQTGLVEEIAEEPQKAIGFSTFVDKATRAENSNAIYDWSLASHHGKFVVYGYKTVSGTNTSVFTTGENITVNSSTGVSSTTKYWDKAASGYGFFACAGAATFTLNSPLETEDDMEDDYFTTAEISVSGTNLNSNAYSIYKESFNTTNADNGEDLMIAAECKGITPGIDKVPLKFDHILSRLNVMVKSGMTTDANNYIKIKEVAVNKLIANGKFDESTIPTSPATLQTGTYERWSRTSPTTVDNIYNSASGEKLTNVPTDHYVIQALVMPQLAAKISIKLDGSDAESLGKPYIKIKFSVTTNGIEQPDCTYYYNLASAFGVSEDNLAFNEGWQNNLTITINPKNISFDSEVAIWAAGTTKDDFTIQ